MDYDILNLAKALDTSNTNGNNLLDPVLLSRIVSEQVRLVPALRNAIPRISWQANVYDWVIRTNEGGASSQADMATIPLTDPAFGSGMAKMSFFYRAAYISNPAIAATQLLLPDLVAEEIGHAVTQVMRFENAAIYNGDPNNSTYIGLNAALAAGANGNVIGSGATASLALFAEMDSTLRAQGYQPGIFVVTPGVYAIIAQAAYDKVRFIGNADIVNVSFPLAPGTLAIGGVPVLVDTYAQSYVALTNETMVAGASGGKNFVFATGLPQRAAGGNYAGTSWTAPVVKVGSTVQNAGTDFVWQADGSITFASTPGSAPTASYAHGQDNIYCLSLNQRDIVIPELLPMAVDNDLGRPLQIDATPYRVKEYCTLAVRDTKAHVMASNVVLPAVDKF